MANVKIRLVVNTEELERQGQVKALCYLVDNLSNPKPKENPKDHCTTIDQAQTIEWSGLPKNPNIFDQVSIDSISYEDKKSNKKKNEKDLFGVSNLTGPNGVIYGTIIANNFKSADEETYCINFTVIKSNGKSESYHVDPKLRVKT